MPRTAFFPLLLFFSLAQPQAWAQDPACPTGNLLAGKQPTAWQEIRNDRSLLTDESLAKEGSVWDAPLAAIFETGASTVTWDLGQITNVRYLAVQADANDTYNVWGSLGGVDYKLMGQIDPAAGHGLRMRTLDLGAGMAARFLRIGEGKGDSFYSVSEVAAYCQMPTPFPPQMKVLDAPIATAPKSFLDYWNNNTSARWQLIFAILAATLLWWERRLVRLGLDAARRRARHILICVMGVLAILTFFNFGFWHFPNFVHGWDTFHYYIGSKYFKELHYERLYECVATADSEEPLLRRRVELRKLTNLRTNVVQTTDEILSHPEICKQHFATPARWEAFKQDLRYFRNLEGPRRWDDAQTDHGFNGTPVWSIMGSVLSNLTVASKTSILVLDAIDVALIFAMIAMMWWAFGWRVASVALMVFATNFPSRWDWIGGSFLRWDWLFWMGFAVCMMKKQRPMWAGAALMYATLLRIFPGFLFVAPLIALTVHYVKTRQWDQRFLRFFIGGALAFAVLVPVSFVTSGGPSIYPQFVRNTIKHSETPLTNNMGLRTVLNYRPAEAANRMSTPAMVDQWQRWKEARTKAFREAIPLYLSLVLCYLVLIGLAIKGAEPWVVLLLSSTLISFGAELTGYYYAFIIIPALLYAVVPRAGEWLLWLTAFTQFLSWAPITKMPGWIQSLMPASLRQSAFVANFSMPNGLDEQCTWISLATLIVFVLIAREILLANRKALVPVPAVDKSADAIPASAVLAPVTAPSSSGQAPPRAADPASASGASLVPFSQSQAELSDPAQRGHCVFNSQWRIGMIRDMKLTALVAVFVISTLGCASTYRPQQPGQISFVLGPGIALHKDGASYSAGGLSSDPIRAVAGNPAAEAHARTYVRRSRIFWSIYAVAVGCLGTSLIVTPRDPGHDDRRNVAIGFGIAGFAALAASLITAITTPGHLYDAVNIYNDGLAKQAKPD